MPGDQMGEGRAVAVDAKRIGERQRDLAAGGMGELGGLDEGLLGGIAIEQIALEIGDLRLPDHPLVDIVGPELD